jgi:hypothetical protein
MHFYSECQGNRTAANRAGTKASGVSAYVQSWTGRINASMDYDEPSNRDFGKITLNAGPHGSGAYVDLTGYIDVSAIVQAADWDVETARHLRQARASIQRANAAAVKACARRDKLSGKAA